MDLLKMKADNRGNNDSLGTVNPDDFVKAFSQGYMIDPVLSTDTDVPERFALPDDKEGIVLMDHGELLMKAPE